MVVVTRSRSRSSNGVFTPSLREASVKSYKIYSGNTRKSTGGPAPAPAPAPVYEPEPEFVKDAYQEESVEQEYESDAHAVSAAANSLTELKITNKYACMNPMQPVTRFMYRIQVFNSSVTMHSKTAFIGYNHKTRMFCVHSIISNCYNESSHAHHSQVDTYSHALLPLPVNTLQVKFSSYITDIIENYIMTLVVPSLDYDYHIQDDILAVAISETEFCELFETDSSSYYDVERLVHDTNATQTINGFKTFTLIPSRSYWFDPLDPDSQSSSYSCHTLGSVLDILSQSR
jgi:hypothetical protein